MAPRVDWFFGRGLSIGCGLSWSVPETWRAIERSTLIEKIAAAVRREMNQPYIDTADICAFLVHLAQRTVSPWQHQFHTTNWDYLLQREIYNLGLRDKPKWCANSHVYHLNGTVEVLADNARRSVIVLETDPVAARISTTESSAAFSKIIWNRHFVVVGMSFECEVDKFLLHSLGKVQDDLPLGKSHWILVNPDARALEASSQQIQLALPYGRVVKVNSTFCAWLKSGMPELHAIGAFDA